MAKHGNRAASSACGAADLLEALGVVIDLPPEATERLMAETGVVFLFAPLYHPALRHTAVPRRELGVPTVFNFLGPVANPARPGALAVGVADPRMGPVIAGVLAGRGCSALVFHGDDGLDELTTTGPSTVWVVHGGTVSQTTFDPAALGIGRSVPGGPARRRPGAQRRGGPRGARRRAGPGAGHRAAERGGGAGRRGGRRRARTSCRRRWRTATRGRRPRWTPVRPRTCWRAGWRPAGGWPPSTPADRPTGMREAGVRPARSSRSRTPPRGRAASRCGTRCGSRCA